MSTTSPLTTYSIQMKIEVNASRKAVWQAMTGDIGKWWPEHFFSQAGAKAFVMECHVGGRVYEDWGNKAGGEWGRLIVYQPAEKLVWVGNHFGGAGKNWGHFFITIQLKEQGNGVMIEFEDTGYGLLAEGMRDSLESGWLELYGTHMRNYVETKSTKPAKRVQKRK